MSLSLVCQYLYAILIGLGTAAAIDTAATAAAPPPHRRTAVGAFVGGALCCSSRRSPFGPHLLGFWTHVLIFGALAAYGGCREWWGRFQTRECPFMRYELCVNVMFHVV